MPIYYDPQHPDCRIDCPGPGGAAFLPPYTCVTWCDDPEKLIDAFLDALPRDGWRFKSSVQAVWKGQYVIRIAETLLNYRRPAPPDLARTALNSMAQLGRDNGTMQFAVAWSNLRFSAALQTLAIAMSDQANRPRT
jgi:hypothetical protein